MKKITLLILMFIPAFVKAQYGAEFLTSPSSNVYIFLGTLPVDNIGNYEKIKVDIFGGVGDQTPQAKQPIILQTAPA